MWRYKTISKESLINEEIRAKEVRLIDADGTQVGIVPIKDALARAAEQNLDLVNISPNAAPPVCKIIDYGKFRYEQQKKTKEARKKQKTMEVKEIRLGIFTEDHDIATKAKLATKFLAGGDKLKITMRFRGREMGHIDQGRQNMLAFCELLKEVGTMEKNPVLEGRNLSVSVAPKSEKEKEKAAREAKKAAEAASAAAKED